MAPRRIDARRRRQGRRHGRKRVARLLRAAGRHGRIPRRCTRTTMPDPAATARADLVRRHVAVNAAASRPAGVVPSPTSRPGKAGGRWPPCSTSPRGGWSGSRSPSTWGPELARDALTNAIAARDPAPGVSFQADRGCQDTRGDDATSPAISR
jgi:putative transposase